ncbi:MAG: small multi-drug export protein [Clostridiales bacterium]|nr:small multi-drug export protein [Clostridiales bacterium]
MLPIVELRGAIPMGVALGLGEIYSFVLAVLGNLVPVPFIIVFIRRVLEWLQKKSKWLDKLVSKKVEKTMKNESMIRKYELLGLMLFVTIPLPGTGAWTGALLAALLDLRLKSAFPAIVAGVVIAGIAVLILTYGFTAIIGS